MFPFILGEHFEFHWRDYHNLTTMYNFFQELETHNPDVCVVEIGRSVEKRRIYAIISSE